MGKTLLFSSQNTVDCYNISLNGFFYDFFLKLYLSILLGKSLQFFSQNIVNCYNVFPHGYCFLPKLSLSIFFNIKLVENLSLLFFLLLLTKKLNHVAKALYLSAQNTMDCYKSFCSVSKFFITNTTFFFLVKYWLHHTFSFITHLVLVHNYNTIKYICFISPRQRAGMPSRKSYMMWSFYYLFLYY